LLTASGTYYDTLQSVNGCDSVICLTLTVSSVGIRQLTIDNEELIIDNVEIYNVVGQKLLFQQSLPSFEQRIATLPIGIYIVKMKTNKGILIKKIIK
jgi:hypothetical protein